MNPAQGRRTWIKLFVHDWLEGTTRYQMSDAQRAFWIDLLAMAGRSRFGGIVCSGKDGEQLIGYPLSKFQGLLSEPIDIQATFALFERTGKISMQVTGDGMRKLYVIFIVNWARYQSEYDRIKKYRKGSGTSVGTDLIQTLYTKGNATEVEGEVDKQMCANPSASHESVSSQATLKPASEDCFAVTRVWDYYIERLGKNPKLLSFTALRKQRGLARLRECLVKTRGDLASAEGLMRVAVDALAASSFHCGENDKKQKYDSWEKNLFRSSEQLENWLGQT